MRNLTGRQVVLVLGLALTFATLVVGAYGLVRGPSSTGAGPDPGLVAPVRVAPEATAPVVSLAERALPHTTDPIDYARALATSLFEWDTSSGFLPTDYTAAILADADPSGEETPGLLLDVTAYVPTTAQWLSLSALKVIQAIDITKSYLPDSWATAEAQAHGQLRPGTTAVTITGTRHRTGMWNNKAAVSTSPVSFTVFLACPPAFDRCHVLRLSQLDNPLK